MSRFSLFLTSSFLESVFFRLQLTVKLLKLKLAGIPYSVLRKIIMTKKFLLFGTLSCFYACHNIFVCFVQELCIEY